MLSITITTSHIYYSIVTEYVNADPIEFYCQSNVNTKPLDNNADTIGNYQMTTYLTGLSVAFVILLVAVLVHQFMI